VIFENKTSNKKGVGVYIIDGRMLRDVETNEINHFYPEIDDIIFVRINLNRLVVSSQNLILLFDPESKQLLQKYNYGGFVQFFFLKKFFFF
jgi:hypothetical protein